MKLSGLNDNTYFQTVATSSVNVALVTADRQIAQPVAVITNTGSNPVFAVGSSIGSAATAVYPTSSTVPVAGKIIAAGSTASYELAPGTSHISFIAKTGSNEVGVSIGSGV